MIKKVIAAALFTAAAGSQADAAVFNGFAIGVNAGAMRTNNTIKLLGYNLTKKHLDKTFGTYAIQFDYDGSRANGFYWGLGLDVSLYSGKANKTISDSLNNVEFNVKYKYNWSSEFDVRLGYNFCNRTVAYGILGLRTFNKELRTELNGYKLYSKKETRTAPVVGMGFKTKIADHISTGIEYRYALEKHKKYTYNGRTVLTEKIANHAVLARVSYHF